MSAHSVSSRLNLTASAAETSTVYSVAVWSEGRYVIYGEKIENADSSAYRDENGVFPEGFLADDGTYAIGLSRYGLLSAFNNAVELIDEHISRRAD